MKKLFILMFVGIFFINLVSADLGCFKQGTKVDIKTVLNTSAANISSVSFPNSTVMVSQQRMNKTGQTFNYTVPANLNRVIGTYTYDYYDAEGNVYVNSYTITSSGECGNSQYLFSIFIIVAAYFLNILSYTKGNEWMTVLTGMFLIGLSIYIRNEGIIVYRDWITNYFSWVTLSWGVFSTVIATMVIMEGE